MEYAGSYALYNYRLVEPSLGLEYSNLRLIRAFEHGLDPKSSEAGFVLVHVAMVRHSGLLVSGAVDSLDGCAAGNRAAFDAGMEKVIDAAVKVNEVMNSRLPSFSRFLPFGITPAIIGVVLMIETAMWTRSKPGSYTQFRTFIFGITSQSMFPNGVIYEGVSDESMSFRGESGANDSMVWALFHHHSRPSKPSNPL